MLKGLNCIALICHLFAHAGHRDRQGLCRLRLAGVGMDGGGGASGLGGEGAVIAYQRAVRHRAESSGSMGESWSAGLWRLVEGQGLPGAPGKHAQRRRQREKNHGCHRSAA